MNDDYSWLDADKVFSVTAEYDKADRGAFFRDDCPSEKWSVRPGAEAVSYRVVGQNGKAFSSPEELILHLYTLAPSGFALDLQMCDQEAGKFLGIWRSMTGRREAR